MIKWLEYELINFNEMYELVLDAARKTFQQVQDQHPDETFYTFGFYQCYPLTRSRFMLPTCHSEEAHMRLRNLTDTERENETLKWFYMRWQVDQWEYHYLGQEHFVPVWQWVNNNIEGYVRPRDQDLIWANIAYKMCDVYLKALKTLDEEKLFGQGSVREGIVLNVIADTNYYFDKHEYARLLNPNSTYERWRIEIEASQHALEFFDQVPRFVLDDE